MPKHNQNPLIDLFGEAQRALPYREIQRDGDREPLRIGKPAASMRTLVIAETPLPSAAVGRLVPNMAAETMTLGAAIVAASRAAAAGANLVILPPHAEPAFVDRETGIMGTYAFPSEFVSVDPAAFSEIDDDEDTPETERPVSIAEISRDGRQFGVRFKIGHTEQKARGGQQVADEVLQAIISGVAQVADKVLLQAILAGTPGAFSLATAAAAGVKAASLRALIGSDATGAEFRNDGTLTAAGITGEFTPTIEETIIGEFARAAIVVGPEMTLTAERLDAAGSLTVQAWVNIAAAVPDISKFWTIEAA